MNKFEDFWKVFKIVISINLCNVVVHTTSDVFIFKKFLYKSCPHPLAQPAKVISLGEKMLKVAAS